MGIFDSLRRQFVEVIEWQETAEDLLAWRFPSAGGEIKDGARLVVRETQAALFLDQGEPADQFGAGTHALTTETLPVLTRLKSWPSGFKSPFKSEVYFVSLRERQGLRWGTPQPVTLRDREFGSVQLRMFGTFSFHVASAPTFFRKVSGARAQSATDELVPALCAFVVQAAPVAFAQSGLPFLDMAANQTALAAALRALLEAPFAALGLALDAFVIESVSLPEELQQALAARQQRGIRGATPALDAPAAAGRMLGGAPQAACSSCARPLPAGARFCSACGAQQDRACPDCQEPAAPEATFCAKCGTRLP